MKTFAINMILTMIKSMMDNGLFNEVEDVVKALMTSNVSGNEKKQLVMDELEDLTGLLAEAFRSTSPWIINLLIEAVVGKYKEE